MRIDVALDHRNLDAELAALHARMRTPGDALHDMEAIPCALPGMVLRYREVAGEFYLYVEDVAQQALAGCTVFNLVPDLDRDRGRHLRSPHSRYGMRYRRRGLARAVYGWALDAGLCLVTGPRQSPAAHSLWQALARTHPLLLVRLQDARVRCLDQAPADGVFDDLETRMVLLGAGWDRDRFARQAGDDAASQSATHRPGAGASDASRSG